MTGIYCRQGIDLWLDGDLRHRDHHPGHRPVRRCSRAGRAVTALAGLLGSAVTRHLSPAASVQARGMTAGVPVTAWTPLPASPGSAILAARGDTP
jgi:hypothetical protein